MAKDEKLWVVRQTGTGKWSPYNCGPDKRCEIEKQFENYWLAWAYAQKLNKLPFKEAVVVWHDKV